MKCPNLRIKTSIWNGETYTCSCDGKKIDGEYKKTVCDKRSGPEVYQNCSNFKAYGIRNSR